MDSYTMESFINWCDGVTIEPAYENFGSLVMKIKDIPEKFKSTVADLKKGKYKPVIDLRNAKKAGNIKEVIKLTGDCVSAIELPNSLVDQIKKRIIASNVNTAVAIALTVAGAISLFTFGYASAKAALSALILNSTAFGVEVSDKVVNKNLAFYRLYSGSNGKMYLIHVMSKPKRGQ